MTRKEEVDIAKIQTDVGWIREQIEADCGRINRLEKLVWVGLGICLTASAALAYVK